VLFPDHPFEPSIQLQEDGRWCVTQGLRNGGTMGSYLNTLDGAAKHAMWLATDPFDQLVDSKKVKR
jgi:hypothetical protein